MSCGTHAFNSRLIPAAAVLTLAVLAAGCSQIGETGSLSSLTGKQPEPKPFFGQTDEHKAAETAGQKAAANPRELQASLDYARSLRSLGNKQAALGVLQQASQYHADNRELASEYGRLALEFDQVALADKLLAKADDPARPDWRVLSARGTVLAKQGKYSEAIPFYERALNFDPGNPSVTNNLAMAIAATGDATRAEGLLRQATATRPDDARIRTNLTILAELQGKNARDVVPAPATSPVSTAAVRPATATVAPRPDARVAVTPAAPAPVQARPSIAPWQTSTASTPVAAPAPVVEVAPPPPRPALSPWQTSAAAAAPAPAPPAAQPPRVAPAVAGWSMEVAPTQTAPVAVAIAEPEAAVTVNAETPQPLPSAYWRRTK